MTYHQLAAQAAMYAVALGRPVRHRGKSQFAVAFGTALHGALEAVTTGRDPLPSPTRAVSCGAFDPVFPTTPLTVGAFDAVKVDLTGVPR